MRALLPLLALTLLAHLVSAAEPIPNFIDYQGRLLNSAGAPIATGTVEVEFRIWDQPQAGTLIWAEKQLVNVVSGDFSVRLGAGQAIGAFNHGSLADAFLGAQRYLGITVGSSSTESGARLAFLSAPFALVAQSANRVDQADGTESRLRLSGIGYSTQTLAADRGLTLDQHTNLIDAQLSPINTTLPVNGANQTLVVTKIDSSTNMVRLFPGAGTINSNTEIVYLKVQGESVTLQNAGGNDWWIISDSRDHTPVGTIHPNGSETLPPGYLACDGTLYNHSLYPELSKVLFNAWGGNAVAQQFNVPDLRGRFLRGVGSGVDPDAAKRLASHDGGNTGAKVGTVQDHMTKGHGHTVTLPSHSHGIKFGDSASTSLVRRTNVGEDTTTDGLDGDNSGSEPEIGGVIGSFSVKESPGVKGTTSATLGAVTGKETRPDNAYVSYIIKY